MSHSTNTPLSVASRGSAVSFREAGVLDTLGQMHAIQNAVRPFHKFVPLRHGRLLLRRIGSRNQGFRRLHELVRVFGEDYVTLVERNGFPILGMWFYEDASLLIEELSFPEPDCERVSSALRSFTRHAYIYQTHLTHSSVPGFGHSASSLSSLSSSSEGTPYEPYEVLFAQFNGRSPYSGAPVI